MNTAILVLHMQCDMRFLVPNAIIAGRLAEKVYKTYEEYVTDCRKLNISPRDRNLFENYMGIDVPTDFDHSLGLNF